MEWMREEVRRLPPLFEGRFSRRLKMELEDIGKWLKDQFEDMTGRVEEELPEVYKDFVMAISLEPPLFQFRR